MQLDPFSRARLCPSTRIVVIVTGSRHWTDETTIRLRLQRYPFGTILLHGAADGADSIADRVGRELGHQVMGIPYFGEFGTAGGPKRNECLVKLALTLRSYGYNKVVCEAFPLPSSRGTWDCVSQCRVVGFEIRT